MMAAFGILVPITLCTGLRYRTALFSVTMMSGLVVEVMGYTGRLLLRNNMADRRAFILFLMGTVTGTTFLSAAVYIVLPHILRIYGRNIGAVSQPAYVGLLFLGFDIFALAFQAVGCAFTAYGISKLEVRNAPHLSP
jgi:hypothetical protein